MSGSVPWNTLPRMLRDVASRQPDHRAVIDGPDEMTLGELRTAASRTARALVAHDVRPGDRVAIWAPNCLHWVVAAFGIWDAGAIVVPLSTRGKGIETVEALRRTEASTLFVVDEFLGTSYVSMLADVAGGPASDRPFAGLENLRTVVTFGERTDSASGIRDWQSFLSAGEAVPFNDAESIALAVESGDPFEILMTSGTTGEPKGVVLSGGQILRAYWDWSNFCGLGEGDRFPVVSPFAHGFGINAGLIICVARMATIVPIAVFDPDRALEQVERLGLTVLAGPPNLFASILENPELEFRDISSLRWAVVGAATVPTALIHAMQNTLGFERVTNAYGLIEGSVVTMTRPTDGPEVVASTAGSPVPGMEVRIVDQDDHEVPAGDPGEVHVRGYGVMQRYWDATQLTADALGDDGWLRTGDIGIVDMEGNLRIVDRKKEMFIVGGFNSYPADIENLLMQNAAVAQAAVIGVPDEKLGEVPWAFVTTGTSTVSGDDIAAWARKNMSNYKVPRKVFVLDKLPVTANGKVAKTALRKAAVVEVEQPHLTAADSGSTA